MSDRVFRVDASALNLRVQPSTGSEALALLRAGQAVARLDDLDHDGWWFVFADTPGEGLYVGYVFARHLRPVMAPVLEGPEAEKPLPPPAEDETLDSPPREPEGPQGDASGDTAPVARPAGPEWEDGWNLALARSHRHASPNHGVRRNGRIDRVIIHIAGTASLQTIIDRFMNPSASSSAHYLITPDGALHQFVSEQRRAWHSGIQPFVRELYDRNDGTWRRFKRYFRWAHDDGWYPGNAVFLDGQHNLLGSQAVRDQAKLVMRPDSAEWDEYAWFDRAFGRRALPIGYREGNRDPNDASIGIEILGFGGKQADPSLYTDAMYDRLGALVDDICARHAISRSRETICGHEDVNPVERWGWDPNRGFEWHRILGGGGVG